MRGRRPNYAWADITHEERLARLMSKIKKRSDGCWEWIGKRFKNGYGQVGICLEPKKIRYLLAHRVMWELVHGEQLEAFKILHKCDRPWCVNPACLSKGTTRDNCLDMHRKGRDNPARGERSGNAKLTDGDVKAIREAAKNGTLQRVIAARYGVSKKQISCIVTRTQWSHIP